MLQVFESDQDYFVNVTKFIIDENPLANITTLESTGLLYKQIAYYWIALYWKLSWKKIPIKVIK